MNASFTRLNELATHDSEAVRLGHRTVCIALGVLNAAIQIGLFFVMHWALALLVAFIAAVLASHAYAYASTLVSDDSFEAIGERVGSGLARVRNLFSRKAA